ncbi:NADH-quinone oxidoreductase subunit A [Criblamydia sequanensis]|uniref:NADH-quinone oxidoreductase subunit A n=1 Tax=Candidatus Criblamydia sequanensis CRIB-18 TaxID=1437425 RepID=A0A090CY97_9BACT|nr:NADH-quinone oxidoreductase subunit A [Criblamydia sequanensis]CDR33432.1 NADH-quinone oxidoreductase subunit A [Criblamydia sequanensis CRIB-18]
MSDFFPVYIYLGLALIVTLTLLFLSSIIPSINKSPVKFLPYESGIQTETDLLEERFLLRHYLVALIFLVFDIEIIFLYPWAVIAKEIGSFAFYEMFFFMLALVVGFTYVWRKGGLQWE